MQCGISSWVEFKHTVFINELYHKYFINCFICLIVPQTLQQLLYLYSCTTTFLLQILKYIDKHTPVLLSTLVSLDARPQDLQLYSQQSFNCKVYLNTAETVASVLCMMRPRGGGGHAMVPSRPRATASPYSTPHWICILYSFSRLYFHLFCVFLFVPLS